MTTENTQWDTRGRKTAVDRREGRRGEKEER